MDIGRRLRSTGGIGRRLEMLKYFPIWIEHEIKCSVSNLMSLHWERQSVIADFLIPGDDSHRLRVRFESVHVIRVLDEMLVSTEEPLPDEGHVADHFAYRVEGSRFWNSQSEALRLTHASARHYLFVTGWACLDVISSVQPEISVIRVAPSAIQNEGEAH
jgi:hypothetical protein